MKTVALLILSGAAAGAWAQPSSVVNSPHNLSASGPGNIRAQTEDQICIFCHTPHNAAPVKPLWNRATPVDAYTIYTSRSLDAQPGQPTGNSKMCLSCHDGTIALGSVVSRDMPILMSGGVTTMPRGVANIGTDLRDDHPISFRFDAALANRDRKLKSPSMLPEQIKLDSNAELQCTSCHDSHDDSRGKFLVIRNDNSELCTSCHQMGTTTVTGHLGCNACHQPHTAPSGPYLLKKATIYETCLTCHAGQNSSAPMVSTDVKKVFTHETASPVDPPPPEADHASCADCHEPHTMMTGSSAPPRVHPNFGSVSGMNASGSLVATASNEYEVCFKCHADTETRRPWVSRKAYQTNTRMEFSPGAVSFHPVEAPGRNLDVPSLRPGWTTASLVACTSCHTSDSGRDHGGSGPSGTHGSNFGPVLAARYETGDYVGESESAYALCYSCHERSSILGDQSFPAHKKHIVDERTPCAACHDAHGIASTQGTPSTNSHLINFATSSVTADPVTGRMEFRDKGRFSGTCFLRCHNSNHSPREYP